MKKSRTKTLVWREGEEEKKHKRLCSKCGKPLGKVAMLYGWKYCGLCTDIWRKAQLKHKFTNEIREDLHGTIKALKDTVSHSRQGKPHKQARGMHVINPYRGK